MSYILDALKRADAERERRHVPGLHAQPLPGAPAPDASPMLPRWAIAIGAALGTLVIAALAWRMGADTAAPVPATFSATPLPAPATPAMEAPQAPMTTAPPPTGPAGETMALAPVPVPVPAPAPTVATRPAPPPTADAATRPAARSARPAAVDDATAPAANTPLPLYAQLPASVRQQFPTLAVSGSVYSEDAAARFIMLNGEVAKEGSQPASGLVVERIEPKSAVLRYKGERFRLPF